MKSQSPTAVLMGDIVQSREHSPAGLNRLFNKEIANANEKHKGIISPLTITLGDEFQGLTDTLTTAFRIAREIRFQLLKKNVSCRFVIGTVTVETEINRSNSWNMMGPGLAEARSKLAAKETDALYAFSFPKQPLTELLFDGLGSSLGHIENNWSEAQIKYVAEVALRKGTTNLAIAKSLGVSSNSLYSALRAAHFKFYSGQVELVDRALKMMDGHTKRTGAK